MIVYLDVLLAVNWVIDFLLLYALAHLWRIPHRPWRLVVGAAVGAAACCVVLLPPLPAVLSVIYKAVTAWLMVLTAFGWHGWLRRTVVLFLLSTAVAGVAMAVWWLAAPGGLAVVNGVVYCDVSPLWLIGCTAAAYGLLRLYARWTRHRVPVGRAYHLRLTHKGATLQFPALFDSGNRLTEPFSGAPVAVVDYNAVAAVLSPAWSPTLAAPPPGARMIPFTSVGGRGALPAFCPERLTVVSEGEEWDATGTFLAVSAPLGQGEYRALIGTELICGKKG